MQLHTSTNVEATNLFSNVSIAEPLTTGKRHCIKTFVQRDVYSRRKHRIISSNQLLFLWVTTSKNKKTSLPILPVWFIIEQMALELR